MNKFTKHTGKVVALYQPNIDTDQILPKQFLKRVERSGYGAFLFYDKRFETDGTPKADFVLNNPRYADASVLLAGKNFGCGSSREHAPWALEDFGFRVIAASEFASIFYNNCFKVGLLPVILDEEIIADLTVRAETIENYRITTDLENLSISDNCGFQGNFAVDEFYRFCLLNGVDEIGLTMRFEDKISEYEKRRENPVLSK
ncbi:MAG: 3-isopropylmalate dehydratase small subunit [Acidobacteriota bacterium]|nr:3-isopropylmalate dehydratase small subunit [Acidobacteriota bacterium]